MATRERSVSASALLFVLVSIVAGCLVAGLALPALALAGAGTKTAQANLGALPKALDAPAQAERSTVLASDGEVIGYFYDQNRSYVPLDKIAPVMQRAVVAIEDDKFYSHGAIDLKGTLRAFLANQTSGSTVQGGSTLTQQYVKQVLVNQASLDGDQRAVAKATDDSYQRKLTELRYAMSVEKKLSKDQILERYLNIAYFGGGAYGIEAAAEHYFDTTAAELTLPQAAMLAGLVRSPDAYDPVAHEEAGVQRRNYVLSRMSQLGVIDKADAKNAQATPFDRDAVKTISSGCASSTYPFVCDYAKRSLLASDRLGATAKEREHRLDRGGLTIRTTIDPTAQKTAQKAIDKIIGPTDPLTAVTDIVEPGTGKIRAMAQNNSVMGPDKGETYYNYSAAPDLGGSTGFQAGSTFKAFTAAAAFEQGIPMTRRYNAPVEKSYDGRSFETCDGSSTINGWTVRNSTGVNGRMNMIKAAENSVNNYFVPLELDAGMCNVVQMTEKLGVTSNTAEAPISSYTDKPSFTLGTAEVNPLSMATAYATFASGGIRCTPVMVDKISTADGKELTPPDADCKRVISADVANAVNDLLSHVIADGTGNPAQTADQRPQAGKTGTIDSNAAVWFAGYTPNAATVSMIAEDTSRKPFIAGKPSYRSDGLKGYTVPSTGVELSGSGGGDAGADLWRPTMNKYLKDLPPEEFDSAPDRLTQGS
ncbi:transglycosylase domain-containing protein [Microlunatus soli]|uniref:Membrane carboxypeptidase (Penicillin-binding protein) n=1 Tax=Microlunatus soli TaxID=630515 RepID=A0A1H1PYZ5_9ACTN|nr:transglycosylase domain-containing protein [Microlunatus soli]SDS16323.1 Membrane carboxypeptidase (penicillin-binding protein) [Microlunatus soli]